MARRDWGGSCAPQHQTQVIFPLDLPLPCSSGCPWEIRDDPPAGDLCGATDAAGTKPMLRMRPPGSRCWCQILWGLVLLSPRCGCCLLPCGAFFGGEPCSPYLWCLAREIFWHLQPQICACSGCSQHLDVPALMHILLPQPSCLEILGVRTQMWVRGWVLPCSCPAGAPRIAPKQPRSPGINIYVVTLF